MRLGHRSCATVPRVKGECKIDRDAGFWWNGVLGGTSFHETGKVTKTKERGYDVPREERRGTSLSLAWDGGTGDKEQRPFEER